MAYLERVYNDFTKGVNKTSNVDLIDPTELLEARNIVLLPNKGYTIRPGLRSIISTNLIPFAYPFNAVLDPKGRGYIIFSGAKMYLLSSLTDPTNNLTLISEEIAFSTGLKTIIPVTYGGKMYFVTGTNYYVWDLDPTHLPTNVVPYTGLSLDHIKQCTILMEKNGWFYASGRADYPNDVYFSEVTDPTRFEATSILTANTNDGDYIRGIGEYLNALVAGKYNSIYTGTGIDPLTDLLWYPLAASEGFTGPRAFTKINNSLSFLGRDGVYMLENLEQNRISISHYTSRLRDFISSIPTSEIKSIAQVAHSQNRLYITSSYPGTTPIPTVPTMLMVGHVNLIYPERAYLSSNPGYQLPFTFWDGVDLYPLCVLPNLSDEVLLFHKSGDYVFLSKFDKTLYRDEFSSSAIPVEIKHKIDLKKPMNEKKFNSIVFYMRQYIAESSTAQFVYKVDYQTNELSPYTIDTDVSHVMGESDWGEDRYGWVDSVPLEFPIRKSGYNMEILLTHNVIDEPFTMYGFGIKHKIRRLKGVK